MTDLRTAAQALCDALQAHIQVSRHHELSVSHEALMDIARLNYDLQQALERPRITVEIRGDLSELEPVRIAVDPYAGYTRVLR